jgi:hypothetical protein
VLADRSLTIPQRRTILSAWASDACAVLSRPVLRLPEFATKPVTFDEIMDTLRELDRVASPEIMKPKLLHGAEPSAITGHG